MDKFLDAYSKWPPANQLVLALVAVVAAAIGMVVLCVLLVGFVSDLMHYLGVYFRGWPPDAQKGTASKAQEARVKQAGPLTVVKGTPEQMATLNGLLGAMKASGHAKVVQHPEAVPALPASTDAGGLSSNGSASP